MDNTPGIGRTVNPLPGVNFATNARAWSDWGHRRGIRTDEDITGPVRSADDISTGTRQEIADHFKSVLE